MKCEDRILYRYDKVVKALHINIRTREVINNLEGSQYSAARVAPTQWAEGELDGLGSISLENASKRLSELFVLSPKESPELNRTSIVQNNESSNQRRGRRVA